MMNFFSYLQEEAGKSKNCAAAATLAVSRSQFFKNRRFHHDLTIIYSQFD